MRTLILSFTLALTAFSAQAAELDDVFGKWLIDTGEAIIEVSPCADSACGKIVWLAEPTRSDGSKKLDRNNPDPELQMTQICGMDIISGFRREDSKWVNGTIYNPDDGQTYSSTMYVEDDGRLFVRGYVGISLLGKSMYATRQEDVRNGC